MYPTFRATDCPGGKTINQYTGHHGSTVLEPVSTPPAGDRLDSLDGLRGIAVFLVVIYHGFARWAEPIHERTLYPHGNLLAEAPFIGTFGEIGVFTFFLISGFVIMLTLERTKSLLDFVGRRAARLWPAMIVCASLSAIIVNWSDIASYYDMAHWHVKPLEYLSSLVFVPPRLTAEALGIPGKFEWVEGVYWTLWHEVRFYALIAIVYAIVPKARFLWAWAAVQIASTGFLVYAFAVEGASMPSVANLVLQPDVLAWFSLGLCGYYLWAGRRSPILFAIAIPALITVLLAGRSITAAYAPGGAARFVELAVIFIPFLLIVARSPITRILTWKPLIALGMVSYPLYLFHELPGMVLMKLGETAGLPAVLTMILALSLPIAAAFALHKYVELPGKRLIMAIWRKLFDTRPDPRRQQSRPSS